MKSYILPLVFFSMTFTIKVNKLYYVEHVILAICLFLPKKLP